MTVHRLTVTARWIQRYCLHLIGAILTLLLPATGLAQNLDVQHYRAAPGPEDIFNVNASRPVGTLGFYGTLTMLYANDEAYWSERDLEVRPITDHLRAELTLALGLPKRIDVALGLPVNLWQRSLDYPGAGDDESRAGLGDLRLIAKGAIVDNRDGGFGLAAGFDFSLPTGRNDAWMGERTPTFTPRLIADYRLKYGALLAVNLGYTVREHIRIRGVEERKGALVLGVGSEVPLGVYGLSILGEINAALAVPVPERDAQMEHLSPVEFLGAIKWRRNRFSMSVGGGAGLTDAYGSPDWRVLMNVGYHAGRGAPEKTTAAQETGSTAPGPEETVEETVARSPSDTSSEQTRVDDAAPGAPPDTSAVDAAPAQIPLEAFDSAVDEDPDPDGDGLGDDHDLCPDDAEDVDQFEDADGCPESDNDQDGIPDVADQCPLEAEIINGVDDDDGCPDQGKSSVSFTDGRILLGQKVFFVTGSDKLSEASHEVLDELAGVLKKAWTVRLVRIEGYTDDEGDPEMNVYLSERRARRVREYLIKRGVAPRRLQAKGFGPTSPIASNDTAEGKATNRRVAFVVVEQMTSGGER